MTMFKIDEVKTWRIRIPLVEPFTTSFGTETFKETTIVGVKTGDVEGYGEVVAGLYPRYSYETVESAEYIIYKYLVPTILGKETNPEKFKEDIGWIKGWNMAKATIEMALWDLYAKLEKKPLYKVIGGMRKKVDVGVSIGIQKNPHELIRKIASYLDKGYSRIKIKIKPGLDISFLDAVRKEYPDVPLTVDANSAYRLGKNLRILERLDKYKLLYIEQPLQHHDLVGHSILQKKLNTPICLDESITDAHKAWEAMEIDATRVINIKPGRVGGVKESIDIHNLAESRNIPVWIGGMLETGIGRAHNISIATLRNVKYPSDISASDRYFKRDLITEPFKLEKESKISVRKNPGIGVEIDWGFLQKITLKEKKFRE